MKTQWKHHVYRDNICNINNMIMSTMRSAYSSNHKALCPDPIHWWSRQMGRDESAVTPTLCREWTWYACMSHSRAKQPHSSLHLTRTITLKSTSMAGSFKCHTGVINLCVFMHCNYHEHLLYIQDQHETIWNSSLIRKKYGAPWCCLD